MYHSAIANTDATKIGVLDQPADDRHQCGIFSSVARLPFGRAVRESRETRRSGCRYANPAQSAHPDWRRGGSFKYCNRSHAMTNQVTVTTSKKCPPWASYVSPTVSTVKVGQYFVTVEVRK